MMADDDAPDAGLPETIEDVQIRRAGPAHDDCDLIVQAIQKVQHHLGPYDVESANLSKVTELVVGVQARLYFRAAHGGRLTR